MKTMVLVVAIGLTMATGAGAQQQGPEVKKPPSQLSDPETWKTQKEKEREKEKKAERAEKAEKAEKEKPGPAAKPIADRHRGGSPLSRGYISGNVGWQVTSTSFSDSRTLTDPGQVDPEKRTFTAKYENDAGPTFDIGGAVRLWRGLGAGVAVTRYSTSGDIAIDGSVPHPLFFGKPRAVSGTVGGTREEIAVHVDAVWIAPVNPRLQIAVFGGPTFFSVKQTLVSDFSYSQQYPYDEATFTGATTDEGSTSVTGFNVGADVGYYFTDVIGIGGIVRFSRGALDTAAGKLDVGGPEVGVGVRIRFPQSRKAGAAPPPAPPRASTTKPVER